VRAPIGFVICVRAAARSPSIWISRLLSRCCDEGNASSDCFFYCVTAATETFTTMASEADGRAYHSTSLLLPDARVLSSGSGDRDSLTPDHRTAQMFSPPYLFRPDGSPAPRPTITSAPTAVSYGQVFTVQTPDAGTVTKGTLIRAGSVTHAFNQSQIIWSLTFTQQDATTLQATAPANAIKAPAGPYLLFLMSANGVPSVARFVTIGP